MNFYHVLIFLFLCLREVSVATFRLLCQARKNNFLMRLIIGLWIKSSLILNLPDKSISPFLFSGVLLRLQFNCNTGLFAYSWSESACRGVPFETDGGALGQLDRWKLLIEGLGAMSGWQATTCSIPTPSCCNRASIMQRSNRSWLRWNSSDCLTNWAGQRSGSGDLHAST